MSASLRDVDVEIEATAEQLAKLSTICQRMLATTAFDGTQWLPASPASERAAGSWKKGGAPSFKYMGEVVPIVPWANIAWLKETKKKVPSGFCATKKGGTEAAARESTAVAHDIPTSIGSGAMAVVAMARIRSDDGGRTSPGGVSPEQVVAVKILKREIAAIEREARCFAREVALLRQLSHKHLLRCHGCGAGPESRPFCLLELIEETVFEALRLGECSSSPPAARGVRAAWNDADRFRLAFELAEALAHLHNHAFPGYSVVHRDLKPDNMGIDANRSLKLFDLGLATLVAAREGTKRGPEETFRLTPETGTQRYLAPESMLHQPYNAKVDVYAWGLATVEMLTLERPYASYSAKEHREAVCPPRNKRPPVSKKWDARLSAPIEASWRKDIANRPSMAEIVAALKPMLGSEDVLKAQSGGGLFGMFGKKKK